jgi:3-phosphoshikimate 1-carboxyvinyltransferase
MSKNSRTFIPGNPWLVDLSIRLTQFVVSSPFVGISLVSESAPRLFERSVESCDGSLIQVENIRLCGSLPEYAIVGTFCQFGSVDGDMPDLSTAATINVSVLAAVQLSCFEPAVESTVVSAISIMPVTRPICGSVRPPGSKSITNRAFVLAALASGTSCLDGVLDSQDTRVMVDSLRRLGLAVTHDASDGKAEISGCAGRPPAASADLWLENSGTSIRFLTAVACLGGGAYRLDGNVRMRERPIGELCEALNALGGHAVCELGNECPPVVVRDSRLYGGKAQIGAEKSSQFLSALLMAAPCALTPVELVLRGELVSEPYVDMTVQMMRAFGVHVEQTANGHYRTVPLRYQGTQYSVEPDASAASYFFAAAAITGGEVTVHGLARDSLQGDVGFVTVLERMGCDVEWGDSSITVRGKPLRGIDVDMNEISDTAQTLAAVAPFAVGSTRIRNVAHIRHKETDRISAVATELRRLGIGVEEQPDGLTIHPGPLRRATVETYDDHRMAMSFALIGLKVPGIQIANPGCTAKTYPRFFDDLQALCGNGT